MKREVRILLRKVISQGKRAAAIEAVHTRTSLDCVFLVFRAFFQGGGGALLVLSSKVTLGILLDKIVLPLRSAETELSESSNSG